MSDPIFGVVIRRSSAEPRPVIAADMSTIGIIGPADQADVDIFPYNTPVKGYSDDTQFTSALGEDGFLADAVRGINDQLADMQRAAQLIIVRTPRGAAPDPTLKNQQTISNIVGSSTTGNGLWAFLRSAEEAAATPRIILAPGYTGLMADGVASVTRTAGGAGYAENERYELTFTGGGPNAVQASGYAMGTADGSLGPGVIENFGAWYDTPPTVAITAPDRVVTAAVPAVPGTGYVVNDTITLANGVVLRVQTVTTGGVATVSIQDPGATQGTPPTGAQPQVSTSGVGSGATFTLTWSAFTTAAYTAVVDQLANPIIASLPGVLSQLLGHAIVESAGASQADDEDWRETINSDRIIALSGGVKVMDPVTSNIVVRPLAPRAAGALIRVDHQTGAPFHSMANQPIYGVLGPGRRITYSLVQGANEAQALLALNVGVVVSGSIGNDFALASGGFIIIATDNAGEDELWRFYNITRGSDYIHLMLLRALRYYLGRFNITAQTVQAIINTVGFSLRDLAADENILGYAVNFLGSMNSAEEIRKGHLRVSFAAEEPPVLRKITVDSARYRPAIDALVASLEQQLNIAG